MIFLQRDIALHIDFKYLHMQFFQSKSNFIDTPNSLERISTSKHPHMAPALTLNDASTGFWCTSDGV